MFGAFTSTAQFVSLEVEEYAVHDGMVGDVDLTGYTTYRLYANLTNEDDFLSAVFAEPDKQIHITTDTEFYQDPFGGNTGPEINPAFYAAAPSVEFDSWVTIGRESSADPGSAINVVQSADDPWIDDFSAGNNIIMDDLFGGSWFALFPDANAFAGPDLKVLIGQFTTTGNLEGVVTLQVFPNGEGSNDEIVIQAPFSSNPDAIFGCTDEEANNFDPAANSNDYSCIYPCAIAVDSYELSPNACPDGGSQASIIINASGGQGATSFSLNGGNPQLSNSYGSLEGGVYDLVITDSQGCEFTDQIDLSDPDPIEVTPLVTDISCFQSADGMIDVTVSGGTGSFSYGLASDDLSNDSGEFTDLGLGSYTVFVEDENGCTSSSSSVSVEEPDAISLGQVFTNDASCFNTSDGNLIVNASGGTGDLDFSIDGETYITEGNSVPAAPGEYNVYVTDENGCVLISDNTYTVNGGDEITIESTSSDASCFNTNDGSIDATVAGGFGVLSVEWMGPNDFMSAETNLADLAAGEYIATVTDLAGCTIESEAITISAPEAIEVLAVPSDALCSGEETGMIDVSAEGGTGELTYSIDGENFGSEVLFDELAPGEFTVTVMDENGCEATVDATIGEPEPIEALAVPSDVLCAGDETGMIDVSAEGGTGEIMYSIDGENFGTEVLFDELPADDYTITVMDENGCEASVDATIAEPDALEINVESISEDAGDGGAIDISVSGGTGEYTIAWIGPNAFTANTEDVDGLEPGDYTVTVTDENGCEVSSDIVQITVGLNEILEGIEVTIMPNPSNGIFVINIDTFNGERMTMRILDAMGRIVVDEQINGNGNIRRDIDLTDQADGFYFLQLNVEEEFRTIKLIKQ